MKTIVHFSVEYGPVTIFAPTNTALNSREIPSDNNKRADTLKYHAIVTKGLNTTTTRENANSSTPYLEESFYPGKEIRFNIYNPNMVHIAFQENNSI